MASRTTVEDSGDAMGLPKSSFTIRHLRYKQNILGTYWREISLRRF